MISVIVPVYNTKPRLLKRCVATILSQSYKNIQLVLVDDCSSSQKTIECLKRFCGYDNRVHLVKKNKNEGVDAARFTGISNSDGEWLAFVDSDDWLEKRSFEKMMQVSRDDVDVIVGSHNDFFCGLKKEKILEYQFLNQQTLMKKYFVSFFGCNKLPVTMWGQLYRKDLIKRALLTPSYLTFGEDLVFNMRLFPHIRNMQIISDIVYNYNRGLPGVSSKYMKGWLENAVKLFECKYSLLGKYPNAECERFQAYEIINYLKSYVRMVMLYDKKNVTYHQGIFQKCIESPVFKHLKILEKSGYRHEKLVQDILCGNGESSWQQLVEVCKQNSWKNKMKDTLLSLLTKVD